jgi:metal-sulfur cluster biosynthetic enzyme
VIGAGFAAKGESQRHQIRNEMEQINRNQIVVALQNVLDPEVGINVIDLGLVYGIGLQDRKVLLEMTMTSPACPLGDYLQKSAERAIRARIPEITAVEVALIWQPVWEPAMMSPEARRQLGWRE